MWRAAAGPEARAKPCDPCNPCKTMQNHAKSCKLRSSRRRCCGVGAKLFWGVSNQIKLAHLEGACAPCMCTRFGASTADRRPPPLGRSGQYPRSFCALVDWKVCDPIVMLKPSFSSPPMHSSFDLPAFTFILNLLQKLRYATMARLSPRTEDASRDVSSMYRVQSRGSSRSSLTNPAPDAVDKLCKPWL